MKLGKELRGDWQLGEGHERLCKKEQSEYIIHKQETIKNQNQPQIIKYNIYKTL